MAYLPRIKKYIFHTCLAFILFLTATQATAQSIANRTFDEFAGMCLLPDDPTHLANVGKYVRPYILSKWFLYDINPVDYDSILNHPESLEFAFNPAAADDANWIEDGLRNYHEAGLDMVPSFKESFVFLTENSLPDLDNKPRLLTEDGTDPWSWRWIGIYFYQFAARYGHNQVPDSMLLLRDDQQRVSGLGWMNYIQGENEADKWWLGTDTEFTPEEWAAYHSVMYDGHMGQVGQQLGIGCGVKEADPNMKVVLGPLAHLDYDYINTAMAWWEANRTDPNYPVYPFDVISMHRYANAAGRQRELDGKGNSPEEFDFYAYAKNFADYCHNLGKEAWITEFGYDTHPGSVQGIIPFGGLSSEDVQGMWLSRTYLEFAAAGMDRAAMYMMRDVTPDTSIIFETSGLTTIKGEWEKKPSWYAYNTMVKALEGFRFAERMESGREDVRIYRFENGDEEAFVVWCPTSENRQIVNYSFNLPAGNLTVVRPKSGLDEGEKSHTSWQGGAFTMPVGEMPTYLLLGAEENTQQIQAAFTADPIAGLAPLNVNFDASISSGGNGTITSYEWEFGDGNSGQGVGITHLYQTLGNYEAQLIVTNDLGEKDTSYQEIQVTDALQQPILFVGNNTNLGAGDSIVVDRLGQWGYQVEVMGQNEVSSADALDKLMVIVSSSVSSGAVHTKFTHVEIPVICYEPFLFDELGMTGGNGVGHGTTNGQTQAFIQDASHPMAGGLADTVNLFSTDGTVGWGIPSASAFVISSLIGEDEKALVFAYEKDALMFSIPAPARRIGLYHLEYQSNIFSAESWKLLEEAVCWAINCEGGEISQNDPPQILAIPDQSHQLGDEVNVLVEATDPNGHQVSFAGRSLPPGLFIDPASGQISGTLMGSPQVYVSQIIATDNGLPALSDTLEVSWTLTPGSSNTSPSIAQVEEQLILAGDAILIQLETSDREGDQVSLSALTLPTGLSFDEATGTISGTLVETEGEFMVEIMAVDDGIPSLSTSMIFFIRFVLPNDAPIIHPVNDQLTAQGDAVNMYITAEDPNGHPILFAATGLPDGLRIDMITGLISGTVTADVGTYTPEVRVTDIAELSKTTTLSFQWTIGPPGSTNQAPVISSISNQEHEQGASPNLQILATDPNGDNLMYFASSLPTGLSIDPLTGLITGTITADTGSYNVSISVVDDGSPSLTTNTGFQWTVTSIAPSNEPPIISPIADQEHEQGMSPSLQIVASDPDGDNIMFDASGLPQGLAIDPLTGLIDGTITANPGIYAVGILVVDDGNPSLTANASFQWTITTPPPPNQAPVISPIADQEHEQGMGPSLQIDAVDPDGDNTMFDASGLPQGLAIDPMTGLIEGTITANPGIYTVGILVVDDGNPSLTANASFQWTVTAPPPPNQAPVISPIADQNHEQGMSPILQIVASDPDGDNIMFDASGLPQGLAIDPITGLIEGTITANPGIYTVGILVVDDGNPSLTANASFQWTVTLPPPELSFWLDAECADFGLVWGEESLLNASNGAFITTPKDFVGKGNITAEDEISLVFDADLAGVYSSWIRIRSSSGFNSLWQWLNGDWEKIDFNNYSDWTWVQLSDVSLQAGQNTLTFAKREGVDIDKFVLSVESGFAPVGIGDEASNCAQPPAPSNNAPVLNSIAAQSDEQGSNPTLQVVANDPDGDNLSFTAGNLPTGLGMNGNTGFISGSLTANPGMYPVMVIVTDDGDPIMADTANFVWTVTAPPPVNDPPVIAAVTNQSDQQGSSPALKINASDPNGDNISYQASNLPLGLSINANTGWISGTITSTPQTYTVTITATDDGNPNLSDTENFNWTITAAPPTNDPPVIAAISNQSDEQGTAATLPIIASDPNGDNLSYQAINLPDGMNINPASGLISGTITATPQVFAVSIIVTDDGTPNLSDTESFNWTVTAPPPVNDPPIISPIADQSHEQGGFASLPIIASDPNGDNLSYQALNLPDGLNINSTSGLISGTITATPQVFAVSIIVTDDGTPNLSDTESFNWTVTAPPPVNDPPIISPIADQSHEQGGFASLPIIASDPNGDNLSYQALNLPDGLNINSTSGLISGTITATPQVFAVSIIVTDDGNPNLSDPESFNWTVTAPPPVNDPPNISPIADQSDEQGTATTLPIIASDPNGDNLSYQAFNLPDGLNINSTSGLISGTITAIPQVFAASIIVTDDGNPNLSATESFNWTVTAPPPPPVDEDLLWFEVECESVGAEWQVGTDAGASNGEYVHTPIGFVNTNNITNDHIVSFSVSLNNPSTYQVWLRIRSSGGYNSFWQEVDGDWEKIDVANYGNWTWVQLQAVALQAGNNAIRFAKREGVDIDKLVIATDANFVPSGEGDPADNCGPQPNRPPVLDFVSNQSNYLGDQVSFFIQADDPDNDALNYYSQGLPQGLSINAVTGQITGTITGVAQSYQVLVGVEDDGEPILQDEQSFQWTVSEVPVSSGEILFVGSSTNLNNGDQAVHDRLINLGWSVVVKNQNEAIAEDALGKDLVVISSSISSGLIGNKYTNVAVPVLNYEVFLHDNLGMTPNGTGTGFGNEGGQNSINIVAPGHEMAAGFNGNVSIYTGNKPVSWGVPGPEAQVIATLTNNPNKALIFGYEAGANMESGTAPARRVGFFLRYQNVADLTSNGWTLFDAAICWAMNCTPSARFSSLETISAPKLEINVFPNPAKDVLKLSIKAKGSHDTHIQLADAMGRIRHERKLDADLKQDLIRINTRGLAEGMYLLRIEQGGEVLYRKVRVLR